MITLIIVNAQNDFITGTMTIKNAKSSLEKIKDFVKNHRKDIDKILFVIEWHPYNHGSFKKYGGDLSHHCIQYTPGACIEPKLLKLIQSYDLAYEVSKIGENDREIGAFDEIEFSQDALGSRYFFDSIVTADATTDFVMCGVADAVTSAILNMLKENITPKVFMPGIISNDGNRAFSEFVKENKLEKTT